MNSSIDLTVRSGLCSSCGLCSGVCPQECIHTERSGGMYYPHVDHDKCASCGLCAKICPGLKTIYHDGDTLETAILGTVRQCFVAWSRDPELRFVSASGGVVTSIIDELLKTHRYDAAFCLNSYEYDKQLETVKITTESLNKPWPENNVPKSRYLPVSHSDAVRYVLSHRDDRVILVGSSCAVSGWRKVIDVYHLPKDNYLLIGLFCDSVFNYNSILYFQDTFAEGKKIAAMHFKNKESGGWPGDMKLFFTDGTSAYISQKERSRVKEYFMPERCLYCIDKLNSHADISVGDNYTDLESSSEGSNSVIVRTEQGEKAWNAVANRINMASCPPEKLRKAQYLDGRENRFYYARLKEKQLKKTIGPDFQINNGVKGKEDYRAYEMSWKRMMGKLKAGTAYDKDSRELEHQFQLAERRKNPRDPRVIGEKILYAIKRRIG